MEREKVLQSILEEIDKIYKDGNFHSTGDIYRVLKELRQFIVESFAAYGVYM